MYTCMCTYMDTHIKSSYLQTEIILLFGCLLFFCLIDLVRISRATARLCCPLVFQWGKLLAVSAVQVTVNHRCSCCVAAVAASAFLSCAQLPFYVSLLLVWPETEVRPLCGALKTGEAGHSSYSCWWGDSFYLRFPSLQCWAMLAGWCSEMGAVFLLCVWLFSGCLIMLLKFLKWTSELFCSWISVYLFNICGGARMGFPMSPFWSYFVTGCFKYTIHSSKYGGFESAEERTVRGWEWGPWKQCTQ